MVPSLQRIAPQFDRPLDPTAVRFGLLFAVVVGLTFWTAVVAAALRPVSGLLGGFPWSFVVLSGLTALIGLGLGSLAYAQYRDLSLSFAVPGQATWPVVVAAVLAPPILVAVTTVIGNAVFDVPLSAIEQRWISPDAPIQLLLATSAIPAVFLGLGYGLLSTVVFERVRDVVGDDHGVALAATLVGFYWLLPADIGSASVGGLIELGLSLIVGVAFAMSLALAYRHVEPDEGTDARLDLRYLPVVVVAAIGLVGIGLELTELPRAVGDLLWVAALAVAILGYERTRSPWVPALSLAAFQIAVGVGVYAEAVLGLVAGP
ncbi:MAG: hypothetical protein ABEH35_08065 [Haloarculaceae archaeon]